MPVFRSRVGSFTAIPYSLSFMVRMGSEYTYTKIVADNSLLLGRIGLQSGMRVLDLGSRPGGVYRLLKEWGMRVRW